MNCEVQVISVNGIIDLFYDLFKKRMKQLRENPDEKNKTEMCTCFLSGEECDFVPCCHFAHGVDELMPRTYDIFKFKCHPCESTDKCRYKTRCLYSHRDVVWVINHEMRLYYSEIEEIYRLTLDEGKNRVVVLSFKNCKGFHGDHKTQRYFHYFKLIRQEFESHDACKYYALNRERNWNYSDIATCRCKPCRNIFSKPHKRSSAPPGITPLVPRNSCINVLQTPSKLNSSENQKLLKETPLKNIKHRNENTAKKLTFHEQKDPTLEAKSNEKNQDFQALEMKENVPPVENQFLPSIPSYASNGFNNFGFFGTGPMSAIQASLPTLSNVVSMYPEYRGFGWQPSGEFQPQHASYPQQTQQCQEYPQQFQQFQEYSQQTQQYQECPQQTQQCQEYPQQFQQFQEFPQQIQQFQEYQPKVQQFQECPQQTQPCQPQKTQQFQNCQMLTANDQKDWQTQMTQQFSRMMSPQ